VTGDLVATDIRAGGAIRGLRSRLGLSQESFSRALDVSARSVERWEAKGARVEDAELVRRVSLLDEIARLANEVYGSDLSTFMRTPRRSLEMRTPKEAIVRGDLDAVREVLIQALEGNWG
jgi:transcriptional regulator with XRE-family HTH domain